MKKTEHDNSKLITDGEAQIRGDLEQVLGLWQLGWWRLDAASMEILWSEQARHIFAISDQNPLSYEGFLNLTHPDDLDTVRGIWQCALEGESCDIEYRVIVENETRWIREKLDPQFDDDGKLTHIFGAAQDISRRKQTEEALHQSQQAMAEAQHIARLGSWELDLQTNQLVWSDEMYRIFEKDSQQFSPNFELIMQDVHPDDRDAVSQSFSQAIANKTSYKLTHRLLIDGNTRYIEAKGQAFYDSNDVPVRAVGTVQDITETYLAEQTLLDRERELNTIIDNIPITIFVKEAKELRYARLNKACQDLMGVSEEDAIGKNDYDFFPKEQADFFTGNDREVIAAGKLKDIPEEPIETPEGQRVLHTRKVVIKDSEGSPRYLLGISEDITERKAAEAAVSESRNLLQSVIDHLPGRVFWKDRDLNYLGCNPQFALDAGRNHPDEMIGKDDFQMGWAHEAEIYRADDRQVMESGKAKINFEEPQTTPDGQTIWLRTSKIPLKNQANEVIGVLGLYDDITEQRESAQALSQFKQTLDQIHDGVFIFDAQTLRFTYVNKGSQNQLGYDEETLLTMYPYDIKPDYDEAGFQEIIAPMLNGEIRFIQFETRHRHCDGHDIPVDIFLQYIPETETGKAHFVATVRDVSERKQAEAELERHRNQLQDMVEEQTAKVRQQARIIEQVHDSIISTDLDGLITSWNRGAESIFGYSSEAMLGKHIGVIYPPEEQEQLMENVIAPLMQKGQHETEVHAMRADGTKFYVHLSLSLLHDNSGNPVGMVGYSIDITDRKAAETALKEAKKAAEDSTLAKSAFLANMSHEIRTPMNAIIGMSHLALQSDLNENQRNYIEKINSSGENLLRILNDILDFSKIESGKLELENSAFKLSDVFDDMLTLNKMRAYEKDISIRLDTGSAVPEYLSGDVLRLGQVLNNLVSNAIKFSDQGCEVTVKTTLDEESADAVSLRFDVIDSGIGISADEQDRLFTAFTQADNSTSRKYGGSGLGLIISKNITEMMGGEIQIDSEKGKGSTFSFTVRLGKVGEAQITELNEQREADQKKAVSEACELLEGRKILLVEDNEINMELVMDLLMSQGMKVEAAYDGQQALDIISKGESIDLVLMDCQMPIMDGYEATRRIREQYDSSTLPVIALTANVMKGDQDKAIAAGMNDHIGKPINPDQMFITMAQWILA